MTAWFKITNWLTLKQYFYQVVPWDLLGTYSKFLSCWKVININFLYTFYLLGHFLILCINTMKSPHEFFFFLKMHLLMVWLSLVHNDIHHEIFSSVIAYVPETLPSAYLIYFSPRDNLNLTQWQLNSNYMGLSMRTLLHNSALITTISAVRSLAMYSFFLSLYPCHFGHCICPLLLLIKEKFP